MHNNQIHIKTLRRIYFLKAIAAFHKGKKSHFYKSSTVHFLKGCFVLEVLDIEHNAACM